MTKLLPILVLTAAAAAARSPHVGRPAAPRLFVPSHESLLAQNAAVDALGLERIKDDGRLRSLVADYELVPVTDNRYVRVDPRLESKRRYCRPWVDLFLQDLGHDYWEAFGRPIQVNSAVRTVLTQKRLRRRNSNAAPWSGDTASAHLAGVAVDLQRRGLTRAQVRFIQGRLAPLARSNRVSVGEELRHPCFHVVVTGEYPCPPPDIPMPMNMGVLRAVLENKN